MNILMYWYGNENKEFTKKVNSLRRVGINVITNSKEDHDYLLKNYPYYKAAILANKYAFASDVWRIWKASIIDAVYIDANTEIKDIKKLKEFFKSKQYFVIEEQSSIIWNGIFYLGPKTYFIQKSLEYYMAYDNFVTGPTMFSLIWKKCKNRKVKLLARETCSGSDDAIFYYKGSGSWANGVGIDFSKPKSKGLVYLLNYMNIFHKRLNILMLFPLYIIKGKLKFYSQFLKGEKKFKKILKGV